MTIEIPLTQGKVALIDDDDLPLVAGYRWHVNKGAKTLYAARNIRTPDGSQTQVLMHRQILAARPGELVDHADRNGLNNRRSNIRFCAAHQNNVNRIPLGKTSRYKGVRRTPSGTWQVAIGGTHLGTFADERDAAMAYDKAAREQYGEFARLNLA